MSQLCIVRTLFFCLFVFGVGGFCFVFVLRYGKIGSKKKNDDRWFKMVGFSVGFSSNVLFVTLTDDFK